MNAPDHTQDAPAPDQIEDTVQSLAELHDRQTQKLGLVQKIANRATGALGRPAAVVSVLVAIVIWMIGNALGATIGASPIDRFPFPDLESFATVGCFLATLLILTTQRHEQTVALRREQLTLHVAVLTEKKIAKVIELLEEQRRDNPMLRDRDDHDAAELAKPADPRASLERIEANLS